MKYSVNKSKTRDYRICTRCVMDTSEPNILFNENGVCNHCSMYLDRAHNELVSGRDAEIRLQKLVASIKKCGSNRDYDVVIGVSGGVDSSMVAYHVAKTLKLRALAVHFDNGWNSELAVSNVKNILSILGIDLHTHVVNWEEFRELQVAFLRASVPNCEIPTDHAINAVLLDTAAQYGVKYILGGGNLATEGILPISWGHYNLDYRHLRAIHKRFSSRPLKTTPLLPLWKFVYYVLIKRIRTISILNLLDYKKSEAVKLLQRELDWRPYGGKHYESIYTRFFQGYILPKKFGFDKRRAHYSTLIMAGDMTRDEALREMDKDPYDKYQFREDREFVIKKLRMTSEEFDEIMCMPPKLHADYPTSNLFFERLSGLKKWFKKMAQGNH